MAKSIRLFFPAMAAALLSRCSFAPLVDPHDDIDVVPGDIVISEVAVSNTASLFDQFYETPDWIELYNRGDTTVDLFRYGLSDNRDDLRKWQCGFFSIAPGGYMLICASGRDITSGKEETVEAVDIMNTAISSWADNRNNPPGNSYVHPVDFSGSVSGTVNGTRVISARLYLDDNDSILKWQTAQVSMKLLQTKNYCAFDRVRMTATIDKGKRLKVHLLQLGLEDWLSFGRTIIGTGVENDRYDITISRESRLDLNVITGFMFSATQVNDSVTIRISGMELVTQPSFMHTGFKLSASGGEDLYLTDPQGMVIDACRLLPSAPDISQGRSSTGTDR
ncbi:MAG: lamin tail domain-containing protein, partial [Chitinispirillaceae bacterium]|nr:lamin tail domain-containing protein [Chitinispirillaceae bacterium]